MATFETIKSVDVKFGNNDFIEVGKKKVISEDGENTFFSLSRGFFTQDGEKRYKRNFSIPDNQDVLKRIIEALQGFVE